MQLTDEAVAASGRCAENCTGRPRLNYGGCVTCPDYYASMPVSSLDRGAIKDEDDEQQTEPTFQVSAVVLNCVNQHAGHCRMYGRFREPSELYTKFLFKSPSETEKQPQLNADLRPSAFIGVRCFVFLLILGCVNIARAGTDTRSRVTISIIEPGYIKVKAALSIPTRSWSFRNAYAGVLGIAERVSDFRATGESGGDVVISKSAVGEYRSELNATGITYTVNVSQPSPADISHVSWVAGDRGFLMFADLIPQDLESLSVGFKLPAGWTVASAIHAELNGQYQLSEPEKAVFLIGRSLRKTSNAVDGMPLDLVVSGTWPFKDNKALDAATRVMKEYRALTGFKLPKTSVVMIAPLPVAVGSIKWRAETRGSTVVLLIDPAASFNNWTGQLAVIFTHEIFHLWVPNSLKLDGDYDWFFEGFTLYTALRAALELKIINFREYLDTLARVYDSYLSYPDDVSLIDASERRWTTPGSFVYDKGMLVAFLCDLAIRTASAGKISLADKYRELFGRGAAEHASGNDVIIAALRSSAAVKNLTKSYIENG